MPRKVDYDAKLSKLADKLQKNEEKYRKAYKKLIAFMEKSNVSPDTALEILEKNLPTT